MNTILFPCSELAEKIQSQVALAANEYQKKFGRNPCLAVILAGNDPGSEVYVRKKGEACRTYGITPKDFKLKPEDSYEKLVALVKQLNQDPEVDAILVQSPLPKGWDELAIQALISPEKDADGFHPLNAGKLLIDTKNALEKGLVPCTPAGVIEILKSQNISVAGKRAVVIGRSNIVGKPMALMLLGMDATVNICHSRTQNLEAVVRDADIVVSAVGKPLFLKREHVKEGAVVIDVGICRIEKDGKAKIVGDVDAKSLEGHASFVTPVPRGVGPMTIALLLRNTVRAAWNLKGIVKI